MDPAHIVPALGRALESGRPALLDVIIDKELHAPVTNFEKAVVRTI